MNYYNEIEPYAVLWLQNLIDAGHIGQGVVDDRSIRLVELNAAQGFTRAHFFAGIAGWDLALQLAGWPLEREVWTGSCPCQPFSVAGKRKGNADERHLWPRWFELITECRPPTIFGEQVASKDGREWLNGVRLDLEALGYGFAAADLCAAGVGAPHIRQRLYWVANSDRRKSEQPSRRGPRSVEKIGRRAHCESTGPSAFSSGVADASDAKRWPVDVDRENGRDGPDERWQEAHGESGTRGEVRTGRVEHTIEPRLEGHSRHGGDRDQSRRHGENTRRSVAETGGDGDSRVANSTSIELRPKPSTGDEPRDGENGGNDFWSDYTLIPCSDGKARRIEPGTFPLAHGIPARVGKLRAYGNAIVPQVAAEFIAAFLEAECEL